MYNLTFHLFVFLFISVLMLPFFLLAVVFIVYERIQAHFEELRGRERRFRDIHYLISVFKDEQSTQALLQEAIEAFNKHFLQFGNLAKESKEYQSRMDFLSAFSWCPNVEIDSVVRYREEFVKANPNYKKEIETLISSALKNREEHKNKK